MFLFQTGEIYAPRRSSNNEEASKTAQATNQEKIKNISLPDGGNIAIQKVDTGYSYARSDKNGKVVENGIKNEADLNNYLKKIGGDQAAKQFQEWAAKQAQLASALTNNDMAKNIQENFMTQQGQNLQTEKIENAKIEEKGKDAELIAANFENMLEGGRKRGKKEDEGGKTTEA